VQGMATSSTSERNAGPFCDEDATANTHVRKTGFLIGVNKIMVRFSHFLSVSAGLLK